MNQYHWNEMRHDARRWVYYTWMVEGNAMRHHYGSHLSFISRQMGNNCIGWSIMKSEYASAECTIFFWMQRNWRRQTGHDTLHYVDEGTRERATSKEHRNKSLVFISVWSSSDIYTDVMQKFTYFSSRRQMIVVSRPITTNKQNKTKIPSTHTSTRPLSEYN